MFFGRRVDSAEVDNEDNDTQECPRMGRKIRAQMSSGVLKLSLYQGDWETLNRLWSGELFVEELQDISKELFKDESEFTFYTEHKENDLVRYRGHPYYRGGPWQDWAFCNIPIEDSQRGSEKSRRPGQILLFCI